MLSARTNGYLRLRLDPRFHVRSSAAPQPIPATTRPAPHAVGIDAAAADPAASAPRDPVPADRGRPFRTPAPRMERAGPVHAERRTRLKSFLCLALVATALPVAAAVLNPAEPAAAQTTPVSVAGLPPGPDEIALRAHVTELGRMARAHAVRLGLRPGLPKSLPNDPEVLVRRASRLEEIVGFLERRREVPRAVDERPAPSGGSGGRGAAAELRRQYLRAARLAVSLGMTRPAPPRIPAGRAARVRDAVRWRAIGDWLAARSEKIRPAERPMRQRVRYYDEFMCIAEHESGGRWDVSTGNGYYGGLQMDIGFQQTYAPGLYRRKGTADHWTAEEQIRAAGRAVAARGFTPWPNTARMCGLL